MKGRVNLLSNEQWQATIIWTTGHGDNTSQLVRGSSRKIAKAQLVKAERKLRRAGAHILITELFRE